MLKRMFAALVLVALSAPCFAQTQNEQKQVNIASVVYVGAATYDWTTTVVNLKWQDPVYYFRETNPLVSRFQDHPLVLAAVGESLDLTTVFVSRKVLHNHPKVLIAGLYAASAIRIFVASRNVYRLHEPLGVTIYSRSF